jgi:hypothetical protein
MLHDEDDDDILSVTNRKRRIILALSDIIDDKSIDKAVRKAAKKTDPRHVEAFMRLEQRDRNIEALSEEAHHAETLAAIAAIPPTYQAIVKLADDLGID